MPRGIATGGVWPHVTPSHRHSALTSPPPLTPSLRSAAHGFDRLSPNGMEGSDQNKSKNRPKRFPDKR